MAYRIGLHVEVYKGDEYAVYVRTTDFSKSHGRPTGRSVEFQGQLLAGLRKDVPLGHDQLATFRLAVFCDRSGSEGFPQDRMGILALVYHREGEVHEEDLLSLHDEMTQMDWRVVQHAGRVDLA